MKKKDLIAALARVNGKTLEENRVIVNTFQLVAHQELRERGVFAIADLIEIRAVDVPARSGTAMGHDWHRPAHRGLRAKIIGGAKRLFEDRS